MVEVENLNIAIVGVLHEVEEDVNQFLQEFPGDFDVLVCHLIREDI